MLGFYTSRPSQRTCDFEMLSGGTRARVPAISTTTGTEISLQHASCLPQIHMGAPRLSVTTRSRPSFGVVPKMSSLSWRFASVLFPLVALASGAVRHAPLFRRPSVPVVTAPNTILTDVKGAALPPLNTTYIFDQLIDHNNPSLGTFQQRYWTTWEFYESGGPIVLFTPGEANAEPYTGYLTNLTINGQIAQQEHAATIVLEHRFFGLSNPHPDLSVQSLQVLNIQQAIDDLEYFAQNVQLPMPGGDKVSINTTPWILVGGSYSGALTGWTMVNKPGLFKAAYASSAVVEAITDYWGYFEPIRQYMATNCSADVEAVIAHIDSVFTGSNQTQINQLKAMFGWQNLTHLDDAAGALRNNLWDWQSLSPDSGGGVFFEFCDALEVKDGVNAPASGWGLDHALPAWATFWTETYYALICGDDDAVDCLGSYDKDSSYYTDTSLDNANRSWLWFVCNQVGFFQEGAPVGHPTLVTRLVQPPYDERQCAWMFPGIDPVPRTDQTNALYQGWNGHSTNLFFANGHRDPWREATVSADGHNEASTSTQPIAISDGFHCSDLITDNGAVDSTVLAVQQQGLAAISKWMKGSVPSRREAVRFEREY
ncbi:hypothetical protein NM688_g1004 [Phlebia brevispora]|uniref:Uncharacterized protein n=1 Tax=Phlebia brevispora TaxID=194682 RepID=A0ACC1TCM0_9APHY|nr:hypothetical protein NM688_g1004 [Phlebia brevispora]